MVKCTVVDYHKTSVEIKELQKWNQTEGRTGRATRRTGWTLGGRMDPRQNKLAMLYERKNKHHVLSTLILYSRRIKVPFLVFGRDGL